MPSKSAGLDPCVTKLEQYRYVLDPSPVDGKAISANAQDPSWGETVGSNVLALLAPEQLKDGVRSHSPLRV